MLLYKFKVGKAYNGNARALCDRYYKPALKGFKCRKPECKGKNTTLFFEPPTNPQLERSMRYDRCCDEFEALCRERVTAFQKTIKLEEKKD
jgi:hypothetical protein